MVFPEYIHLHINDDFIIEEVMCSDNTLDGWKSSQLKGKPVTELFDEGVRSHIQLQLHVLAEEQRESSTILLDPSNPDPVMNSVPFQFAGDVRRLKWNVRYVPDRQQIHCLILDVTREFQRVYSSLSTHQYNEQLVERVTDGVITYDSEGRVVSANNAAHRSLGLTWLQLSKRALIHPSWHLVKENKERHPGLDAVVHQVLRERVDRPTETVGIFRPDEGRYRWFEMTVMLHRSVGGYPQGAGLVLKDITTQAEMIERVKQDKLEVMHLAQKMHEGIWISTHGMQKTVFVNDAFRQAVGIHSGKSRHTIRASLTETVHPDYREQLLAWFGSISTQQPYAELTAPFLSTDGTTRWFKASMFEHHALIPESSSQRVVLLRDVTDEMELVQRLEETARATEALSSLKSNIIANISHEFRTPLTGIIGFSTLAAEVLPEQAVTNFIKPIADSAERLSQTLTTIADFSLLESGSMGFFPRTFSPVGVLDTMLEEYTAWCREAGLTFHYEVEGQHNALTDQMGMMRIVNELVRNAVKFTVTGYVRVNVINQEAGLTIQVSDTGEGIPADQVERVFEPFRQLSEGISRKYEGVGLGMAVVRKQVDLMQGSIRIEPNKPTGTSVTVVLPHLTGG